MASIPKKVIDRFSKELGKFQGILKNAKNRDLNEADTVDIVNDMFGSIFGFDKYTETTREFAIRNTYCDLAIKIKGEVKYLVEVKAVGLDLKENHLQQAINYGANHGIRWIVLTNGIDWEIHRIQLKDRVNSELVGKLNILEMKARKTENQEQLFLLCKEGLTKDAIEEYHEHQQSVNRFSIGAIVLGDPVTELIRRELRRISPGLRVDKSQIESIVKNEVLKREIIEGENAKKATARYKRASNKLRKKKVASKSTETDNHPVSSPNPNEISQKIDSEEE